MKRDRIIFDVSMAQGGGGFTYAVNVLPSLAERLDGADLLVLTRNRRLAESIPTASNLRVELMPEVGFAARIAFLADGASRVARNFEASLYYSASELSLELSPFRCPCPKIAAFRNPNIFTALDQHWPWTQRIRLATLGILAKYSVRTCDRILFVSGDSSEWIGRKINIPQQKRVTVPHGIDPSRWVSVGRDNPLTRPYILSVSSVYRYKNFVRLINAWTRIAARWPEVPDLVIVGDEQDRPYGLEMERARRDAGGLASRIHLVGEVPYSEISAYYEHANAFVFPSYLETFGHPLLEAMAAGLPVVASDIGVFREIGGKAAIYFPPYEIDEMATAIERAVRDESQRAELVRLGHDRVAEYPWQKTVERLKALFGEVLRS